MRFKSQILVIASLATILCALLLSPPSLKGENLSVMPLPEGPPARYNHCFIHDTEHNDMIIFGGATLPWGSRINDLWKLDLDTYIWSKISASGDPPPEVSAATAIYDPVGVRMLVYGGGIQDSILSDLYELDLNSYTWSILPTNGTPPSPRWNHTAVYNSQDHSMVVFAGRDMFNFFNDLWILDLSNMIWNQISAYGPSQRIGHTSIYYPDNNSMIVFGGWDYQHFNDLWDFDFDTQTWTELSPLGELPNPRNAHTAAYDEINKRMLVFGGAGSETGLEPVDAHFDDIWELDLVTLTWNQFFPILARDLNSLIYDSNSKSLVIFGGEQRYGMLFRDGYRILLTDEQPSIQNGDVNCDGEIDLSDVIYLANYLLKHGPPLCEP